MKKNLIIVGTIILLAVIAILTVWRMGIFGTRPIAPSAPESKPKAVAITAPAPGTGEPGPNKIPANITPAAGCRLSFALVPTLTPPPQACSMPAKPVLHSLSPLPVHSKVDLSWDCHRVGCYVLERYEYPITGSCPGGKTCGEPTGTPVATMVMTNPDCSYSDLIVENKDKCVAYKIVAKDFTSSKTCSSCTANDGTNCCLIKSDALKICGLPAQPGPISRVVVSVEGKITLTWVDNSTIEDGFRLYRNEGGSDNFNLTSLANPVKVLAAKAGSGGTYPFDDNAGTGTGFELGKINSYRYSVRAFTDRCGCGAPVPPTSTPIPGVPACLNVQTTISAGGNLSNLKTGDVLTFTVNFSGTVEDVAVIIKKDGVRVATFSAGSAKTNAWTSPSYTISSLGLYEVIALVKVGGAWQ